MESLQTIRTINYYLNVKQYDEAFCLIDTFLEVLAPHISVSCEDLPDNSLYYLTLCKLYLVRQEYPKAIEFGLKAKNDLKNLNEFFFQTLVYRMMEQLINTQEKGELREYVLNLIKDDELSDSLLGFLVSIKEFDLLKEKVILLSNSFIPNTKIVLQILVEIAHKELMEILPHCNYQNSEFLELVVDSLIFKNDLKTLKDIISSLSWDKMYSICFYIEDNHKISLNLENNNANFILSGEWKKEILSNFLFKNNKTNFKFIESLSKARVPYISLCNSIMNAGSTNDSLFRNNRNIVTGKSWTRFLEFASIGIIYQTNVAPFEILKEVLPTVDTSMGEAGALLALGIMSAGKLDEEVNLYLAALLENTSDEMVFGACLGIGLNMLESKDDELFEKMKHLFTIDNTISQESALYSIGLIYASSGDKKVLDFITSVHEKTDFLRVKRVCGLASSLVNIMVDETKHLFYLLKSDDASKRSMALMSLGTAYCATSNVNVIDIILPFVNDGDDDVKRSAVIAIGLIGYGDDDIKTICLIPLAENHNIFVRSAAALVLGFNSCGTCDNEICALLEAMLYDSDDLVKQSACIGLGFALVQGNPTLIPNYKRVLDRINYMIVSRNESSCVKIGAAMGRSFAESAGKAGIFTLKNFSGQIISTNVIGAVMFLYSWYWMPCIPMIALCLHPTPLFFFDENLNETDHFFMNSDKHYNYLVKLPELKKSRKFKQTKTVTENKDVMEPCKNGLKSGDTLTYKERLSSDLGLGIIFKKK